MLSIRKLIRNTTYRLKNFIRPLQAQEFNTAQIESFRRDVNTHFLSGHYSETWTLFAKQMKESFLNQNPSDFLQWELIKYTITSFNSTMVDREYNAIKRETLFYSRWKFLLLENGFGNPDRFWRNRLLGTNKIHQTYHLLQLTKQFAVDLKNIEYVLEFGGGYGNMCSLFSKINTNIKYTIFDLPELLCLQKFYLNALHLPCELETEGPITLTKNIEMVAAENKNYAKNKLFIATWSLSESPFELRDHFISILDTFEYILIAYQKDFDKMGNRKYFSGFQRKLGSFNWSEYPILTMNGSYYLLGKRN